MNKRELSRQLNMLLGCQDNPINFEKLTLSDLQRLLSLLGNKQAHGLPLKVSIETQRAQPLLTMLRERPILKKVLGE